MPDPIWLYLAQLLRPHVCFFCVCFFAQKQWGICSVSSSLLFAPAGSRRFFTLFCLLVVARSLTGRMCGMDWIVRCGLRPQVCDGAVRHVREGVQAGLEPRCAANRAVHVLRGEEDGLRRR